MPSAGDMAMARELQSQFSRQGRGGGGNSRSTRGRGSSRGPPMESQRPFQPNPAPRAMAPPQPPGESVWSGPLLTPADLARHPEPSFQSAFAAPVNNITAPSYPAGNHGAPYSTAISAPPMEAKDHPQTMFSYNDVPVMPPVAPVRSKPVTNARPGEYAPRSSLATSTNLVPTAPVFKPREMDSSAMSVDSDYNPHLNGFRTSGAENSQTGAESGIVRSGMASGRGLNSSRWA